jgi:Cu-Zn family superoxide dismutase
MSHSRALILASAVLALAAAGCKPKPEPEPATAEPPVQEVEPPQEATVGDMMVATATLKTADGTDLGTVTFTQHLGGDTEMVADLHGVQGAGEHGIHVHEVGECSAPDFKSAGGHFNPQGTDHACPPTTPRHAGATSSPSRRATPRWSARR